MKLTDTAKNTEIVYLYVRNFSWRNALDKEANSGHPQKDRLYRAIYNTDTKTFRIFYKSGEQTQGVYIPELVSDADFSNNNYDADIVQITKNNILDHNISEEDLDEFCSWIDDDNKSLKKMVGIGQPEPSITVLPKEIVQAFAEKQREDDEFLEFVNHAAGLKRQQSPLFDAISDVVVYLATEEAEDNELLEPDWLRLSPVLGAGKNISDAITYLTRYASSDRRVNFDQVDLILAIKALLIEQARRNFHG